MMKEENRRAWNRMISRLRLRVNSEILAEASSLPLGLVLSALAVVLYMGRRMGGPLLWILLGGLIVSIVVLAWSLVKARRTFFSERDAKAYLDEQLGLHAALSASSELDVPLPSLPESPPACVKRKSWGPFYPVAGGILLVIASWMLPLPERDAITQPLASLPPALKQVADWVDMAEKTPEITPESIEEFQRQMDELLAMTREEMYTHSGLEAADAMKENIKNASEELSQNLDNVSKGMNDMQGSEGAEEKALSMESLGKALASMEQSRLSLGGKLGDQLRKMNANSIGQMTPEQLKKLQNQLKQAQSSMNSLCEKAFGEAIDNDVLPEVTKKYGEAGPGGPGGGGGPAPMSFVKDEYGRIAGKDQQVAPKNMDHAALGDQLGVEIGEHNLDHEIDKSSVSGGAAAAKADGGSSVWVDDLTPAEKDAIKKVFN